MSYATISDLTTYYDERTIADLVSDNGVRPTSLAGNAVLTASLASASGRVEAACTVANLYTPVQLATLTDNASAMLKQIVCRLAIVELMARRIEDWSSERLAKARQESEDYLDRIRKGERIFGILNDTSHQDAGLIALDAPSVVELDLERDIVSVCAPFYPVRRQRVGL